MQSENPNTPLDKDENEATPEVVPQRTSLAQSVDEPGDAAPPGNKPVAEITPEPTSPAKPEVNAAAVDGQPAYSSSIPARTPAETSENSESKSPAAQERHGATSVSSEPPAARSAGTSPFQRPSSSASTTGETPAYGSGPPSVSSTRPSYPAPHLNLNSPLSPARPPATGATGATGATTPPTSRADVTAPVPSAASAPYSPPVRPIDQRPVGQPVGQRNAAPDPPDRKLDQAGPTESSKKPLGLLDLHGLEELVCEVDSGDDGKFVLTSQRLIYQGRSAEGSLFSATSIEDVTTIDFGRRARDSRSAWWGSAGLIAAVAVWQVTTNETVGAVAGAIVAGIALLLLADYWFRPAGLVLKFGTAGGAVQGPVSSKRVRDAEDLAARVQQMKQSGNSQGKTNSVGSSGRPPGGSPGLG